MIDLVKHFMSYFFDKTTPNTSKITGFIILLFIVVIFNNIFGFSFYYNKGRKIELLHNIEELKQLNPNDSKLISTLEQDEAINIEKKNVHTTNLPAITNPISDTFTSKYSWSIDSLVLKNNEMALKDYVNYKSTIITKNIKEGIELPQKSRSQFWHTVTSSFAVIILMLSVILISPFQYKELNGEAILGLIILEVLGALFVWLSQYLFGLIPVINNMPVINYGLNAFLHIVIISLIILAIVAANKRKNK